LIFALHSKRASSSVWTTPICRNSRFEKWRRVRVGDAGAWYVPESRDVELVQRVPYPRVDDWESTESTARTASDILEVDVRRGHFLYNMTVNIVTCELCVWPHESPRGLPRITIVSAWRA
jgi:hypothetical protein